MMMIFYENSFTNIAAHITKLLEKNMLNLEINMNGLL